MRHQCRKKESDTEAKEHGKSCLVIERRNHVGGNIYCENIEGIHIHKYGLHIFHTDIPEVWEYAEGLWNLIILHIVLWTTIKVKIANPILMKLFNYGEFDEHYALYEKNPNPLRYPRKPDRPGCSITYCL